MAFDKEFNFLVSGSGDKTVKIWNYQTGEVIDTIYTDSKDVHAVVMSQDGKICAAGNEHGKIIIWSVEDRSIIKTYETEANVMSIAISDDGKLLACGGEDKIVKVWNLEKLEDLPFMKFVGH